MNAAPFSLWLLGETAAAICVATLGAEAAVIAPLAAAEVGAGAGAIVAAEALVVDPAIKAVAATKVGIGAKLLGGVTVAAGKVGAAGMKALSGLVAQASTMSLPELYSVIDQVKQIKDTITDLEESQSFEDTLHTLENVLQQKQGETIMEITTQSGHTKSVASQGLGVWGAVGGALGTLALVNQLGVSPLGFAGGRGYNNGGVGSIIQQDITIALADENAMLKSKIAADAGDDRIWKEVSDLKTQVALNAQAQEFLFREARAADKDLKRYVDCHFVRNEKFLSTKALIGGITADGYTMTLPTAASAPDYPQEEDEA